MSVIKVSDEERAAEALLEQAEIHCREMLGDLEIVRQYYKDKDDLSETELRRVLNNVAKSVQTVFDERRRLDEFRKRHLGIVNEYALDFDQVRSEVGSRLDRIRAARDAGEVPQ